MKIAIVSDTHNNHITVKSAVEILRERNVSRVIHCGDICDVETVRLFEGLTADFVFGNCDYERANLRLVMAEIGATLHEPFGHLDVEGVKLAFVHGDDPSLLEGLEYSGQFDFVFYGHTHMAREHRRGCTRVVNVGALYRARTRTFGILDLETRLLESITVP